MNTGAANKGKVGQLHSGVNLAGPGETDEANQKKAGNGIRRSKVRKKEVKRNMMNRP